ncbi:alkaline phosphatase family protein [Ectothiorhodospira lacustris]|uniref:alkaline phosphatase family protein n=1 Tax=Ectothiorhodospira lacustris TaxID=2899127 RepID=UPI001EE8F988|nr:alkaline phosphatase family protein [Ectothiorhodospira lacustris]MCG5509229.1 alkaline phosphatase family protein [Ectothiorhodospira lacustris]MCG5521019.1 alkaline phosphatase family protein [Ectothiorhodospira lacustris]
MQTPDYQGHCLANLMTSLISGLGGTPSCHGPLRALPPEEVGRHRHVVLVVVDGLGDGFLKTRPAPFLNGHRRAGIHAVFPTTTATGITTFITGDAPAQHGLTGWHVHFRELGTVLAVLPGKPRYGGSGYDRVEGLDVLKWLGHDVTFNRIPVSSTMVAPNKIANTPFNKAHRGRARLLPFSSLQDMVNRVEQTVKGRHGNRYVYAYWSELDSLGHYHGPDAPQTRKHLEEVDRALANLAARLAGTDTLLIITADHGMTAVEHRLILADHPEIADCLTLPLCGEPRVAWAYVRHGRHERFERLVRERLGHACTLRPSAELLEEGWFGPGTPHPELSARIGDYALLMQPGWIVSDRLLTEKPFDMKGVHGGLTPEELEVPLVVTVC